MLNFKNKTVMITGAAGNLGRAVAEAFGSRGANLVLLDLNGEALESAYPGDDAHSLKCAADLMKADDIAERHFSPSHTTPSTELAATRTSY